MIDMKYTHVGRKPGDVVWAFAYSGENRIRGRKLRQPPVEGMLLSSKWEDSDQDPTGPVKYFVPFGKDRKPNWSKVVMALSRRYADTEAGAVAGYNAEVIALMEENLAAVREAADDLLPGPDGAGALADVRPAMDRLIETVKSARK